jgi:hypothetical protein
MNKEAVVFTRHPDDSREGKKGPGFFQITRSRNLLIRNLHFTGRHPIGYATHFGGNKNILMEGCSWIGLPSVYYGATGTAGASSDHVNFRNCVFKRVGSGGHAQMAYNAYTSSTVVSSALTKKWRIDPLQLMEPNRRVGVEPSTRSTAAKSRKRPRML